MNELLVNWINSTSRLSWANVFVIMLLLVHFLLYTSYQFSETVCPAVDSTTYKTPMFFTVMEMVVKHVARIVGLIRKVQFWDRLQKTCFDMIGVGLQNSVWCVWMNTDSTECPRVHRPSVGQPWQDDHSGWRPAILDRHSVLRCWHYHVHCRSVMHLWPSGDLELHKDGD